MESSIFAWLTANRMSRLLVCAVGIGAGTSSGCANDEAVGAPDGGASGLTVMESVVAAMGGNSAVTTARNEVIVADSTRFDPGEASRFGETTVLSEFTSTQTAEFAAQHLRLESAKVSVLFGSAVTPNLYTQTLNENHGYLTGSDFIFAPPPEKPSPMPSARVATQYRQADLASPLRLIRRVLAEPQTVTSEADAMFDNRPHKVLRIARAGEPPIRLFIDATTSLPAKAETLEDHPPIGDTRVEAIYRDYRDVGALKLPFHLTMTADDLRILLETRSKVGIDGPPVDYAIPADLDVPFDEQAGAFGRRSSQYLLGLDHVGLGIAYYVDQSNNPVELKQIVPGVFHVLGANHQPLLIEMKDELVLVDGPLYEGRSANVLKSIKARFPNKPLRHIIATHFHFDHSGGIRHFAAEGNVTVWAGSPSVEFFRKVMSNPHSVAPDRLQENPVPVQVKPVETLETLSDGTRTVEIRRVANSHADDMVIVYLPAEKLAFVSDLYNPNLFPPKTKALPPFDRFAGEFLDEVKRLGLQVDTVVGAHGPLTGTLGDAQVVAGRQPGP